MLGLVVPVRGAPLSTSITLPAKATRISATSAAGGATSSAAVSQ
jgi:hypothetical protein